MAVLLQQYWHRAVTGDHQGPAVQVDRKDVERRQDFPSPVGEKVVRGSPGGGAVAHSFGQGRVCLPGAAPGNRFGGLPRGLASRQDERKPAGGLSFVLADGQTSGEPAKAVSGGGTRKAHSPLAEGVRDGAAARAASDYLFTYRAGKVLATLNILSIDLYSRTLVVTRNSPVPVLLQQDGHLWALVEPSDPVGSRGGIRPVITEVH